MRVVLMLFEIEKLEAGFASFIVDFIDDFRLVADKAAFTDHLWRQINIRSLFSGHYWNDQRVFIWDDSDFILEFTEGSRLKIDVDYYRHSRSYLRRVALRIFNIPDGKLEATIQKIYALSKYSVVTFLGVLSWVSLKSYLRWSASMGSHRHCWRCIP